MSESATNSSKSIMISQTEIFHLYFSLNLFFWLIFILIIFYEIYQNIYNKCLLKALLKRGDQQIAHSFVITIIASEPTLSYDYDNTSIRLDLNDRNGDLITSLIMRPLFAFQSLQQNPDFNSLLETPKESAVNDISNQLNIVNLSRRVPLIGIYKLVSENNLRKVKTILMAHDCPHPNASILIRCIEISDISSLISHTYPLNAFIPHLSKPMAFVFDSHKKMFEFEEELPQTTHYQLKSLLNSIERAFFWLFSFNVISFNSYFWSQSYEYEATKEWVMWYKALILSLIIGSLAAIFHLIITISYRLYKEYNLFNETNHTICIKRIVLWTVFMISIILLSTNIAFAYHSIKSTLLFRWYRITFLSSLVFIILSAIFTFVSILCHIKPKLKDQNSFDASTLNLSKEDQKFKKYEMIVQNCRAIQINNIKNTTIFCSSWVRSALNQHQGLETAILCDIYDVMLLPKGKVTTNLAENLVKLFGEQNVKDNKGVVYATRAIDDNGMAVSVSQYGRKKKDQKQIEDNKELNDNENNEKN